MDRWIEQLGCLADRVAFPRREGEFYEKGMDKGKKEPVLRSWNIGSKRPALTGLAISNLIFPIRILDFCQATKDFHERAKKDRSSRAYLNSIDDIRSSILGKEEAP